MRYFNRFVAVLCSFCVLTIGVGMWAQHRLKRTAAPPVLEWVGPSAFAADTTKEPDVSVHDAVNPDSPEQHDERCSCAFLSQLPVLVDINNATAEQLIQLPGIGPAYAERIIAMRTLRGGFVYVEELLEVSGIGPARFAQLEPLVFVGAYEEPNE